MAKYSNTVSYNITTNLNSKGVDDLRKKLSEVQKQLYQIQQMKGANKFGDIIDNKSVNESYETIKKIQKALTEATDFNTGQLNASQFESSLKKANVSTTQLVKTFKDAGSSGQRAFNTLAGSLAATEVKMSRMSATVSKLFNTFQNTVRWGITASIFETASNSVGRAVEYMKDLDRSLNDIRIVSGYSADDMNKFAESANKAAQALGQTTTAYTDASLIYIQQGKNLEESKKLADLTLKTANVTGQATAEVSEQLTSIMNGYKVAVDDMESVVDKFAKVAAVGASDMEELATAASKVASTANALGVDENQLVSQLSTIISVTRQAPENVGNAMKTIYARLGDLQLGDTLEDGTTVGQIGDALKKVDINIQTANGDLRNMGEVIEELMGKWGELTTAEQQALAVKLAGKYQYNNLIALLDNAEMYNEQLQAAENSLGTVNEQQQIYMDSLEGKLNSLQAAFEGFLGSLFNTDEIKPAIDDITGLVQLLTSFTSSVGSTGLFAGLIGTGTRVFSSNVADSVGNLVKNRQARRSQAQNAIAGQQMLRSIGEDPFNYAENSMTYSIAKQLGARSKTMNDEQLARSKDLLKQISAQENEVLQKRELSQAAVEKINIAYQALDPIAESVKITEDGQVDNLTEAVALIGDVETAFKEINTTSLNLQTNLKRTMPNMNDALNYFNLASGAKGSKRAALNRKGLESSNRALDSISNNEIFVEGSAFQKAFSSMPEYVSLQQAFAEAGKQSVALLEKKNLRTEQIDTYSKALVDLRNKLLDFVTQLETLDDITPEAAQNLKDMVTGLSIGEQTLEGMKKASEDLNKELDFKNATMSIVSLAGDLAQLYGVLQSIKSLGTIFADDSISDGEKTQQIIENLVFTLPLLLSAFSSMNTELKNAKNAFATLSASMREVAVAEGAATTGAARLGVALKALVKSNGITFIVSTVLTALAMGVSWLTGMLDQQSENAKNKKQEILDEYDEIKSKTEEVEDAQSKVKTQYDVYKQTSVLTDELTNAIKDYADSLDYPLSKQDLWNENIDKTIEKLNQAAVIQSRGMLQSAQDAAGVAESNLRDAQHQQASNYKGTSTNDIDAAYSTYADYIESYLLFDESTRPGFEEFLKDNGLSYDKASERVSGLALLYNRWVNGEDIKGLTASQIAGLSHAIGGDNLKSLNDPSTWTADEARTLRYYTEQGIKNNGADIGIENLAFGKNSDTGKMEVSLAEEGDIVAAINEAKAIMDAGADALRAAAGVNSKSTGADAAAYYNYGEIASSAASFYNSDEVQKYIETQRDLAFRTISMSAINRQGSGEELTSDDLLQMATDYISSHPELVDLLGSNIIGDFVSQLASNYNIELTDEDKQKINQTQDKIIEASSAYSDIVAEDAYKSSKERLTGNGGASEAAATEQELSQFFDMVGATTKDAEQSWMDWLNSIDGLDADGFQNIADFYQYLLDHGIDPDLAKQVVQNVDNLAGITSGNTYGIKDSTFRRQEELDAQQRAIEKYKKDNAFSEKSDSELDEEAAQAVAAEREYLDKLVQRGVITEEQAHEAFMKALDEGCDNLVNGTSTINKDLEDAARGVVDLNDASEQTKQAFNDASDLIYKDLEKRGYNPRGTTVSNISNRILDKIGDEGLQSIFKGISSEVFDSIVDAEQWVQSAIEAGATPDMIVEWLQEAVQAGVHVDINAEYNGELDNEIFHRQAVERDATARAQQWQPFLNARSKEYQAEYGNNSLAMAMNDVNAFEEFLNERALTIDDFKAMGIDTAGKTIDEIEAEVSDILTGQKEANDEYEKETLALRREQIRNQEAKYGKGHMDEEELSSAVKDIYDDITSKGYTLEELYQSGIDLSKDSSDILSEFYEKMVGSADDVTKSFNELSGSISDFTGLADALDSKDVIQNMMDKADSIYNEEGRAYFTNEEAQDLVKDNPEYIKYLQQVENGWALSKRAVLEYEQSVLDAGKAMETLVGETTDLSAQNESITTMMSLGSGYSSEDGSGYLNQLLTLNNALSDGSIDASSFLDQISDKFDEFFSSVTAQAINAGQTLHDFFDMNDDASNMAQVFSDELYSGIKKLNVQYQAGQITVGQYAKSLSNTASNSIKLKAAQSGLTKTEEGWVKVTKSGTVSLKDMDSESRQSVKEIESMEDSFDRLSAAADFSDYITNNFQEMTKVFADSGEVLKEAINEAGGLKTDFEPTIRGLAETMVDFYKTDELAMQATAQQIAAAGDMTVAQASQMLQSVDSLSQGMMSSSAVAGAAMQGTMTQTQSAINNIATGISLIIQGIMSEVSSIDGEVSGTATEDTSLDKEITMTQDGKTTSVGSIHVPGFRIKLAGRGSSNGAAAKTSQGKVQSAGKYNFDSIMSASDARSRGVAMAADAGSDYVAVYTDGKGNYVATKATDAQRGAGYLGSGVGQLFDSPTLSDYNPNKGSSVPGYTPKYSGGSGGGGGSGSGGGEDLNQKELLDEELDRYEKVNAQLDKMSNILSQISTEQARLAGFNQLNFSQKEIDNLQEQIRLQEEKLEIEKQERQERQAQLAALGATFDSDGYIANYKERFNEYLAEINGLITQYNAAGSKEEQDAIDERISAKQDEFNNYKDLVDKYDTLNSNTIEQTKKDIQDLHDQIEDLMLDIFNKAVDAADSIKDVNDTWVDFLQAIDRRDQDDPILNMEVSSKKIANFFDSGTEAANRFYDTAIKRYEELQSKATDAKQKAAYQTLIDRAKQGLAAQGMGTAEQGGSGYIDMVMDNLDLLMQNVNQYNRAGTSDMFGENQAGMLEAMQTVYDQATQAIIDLRSAIDDLESSIVDAVDNMADEIDRVDNTFDNVYNRLDHYISMSSILHGEDAYGEQIAIYRKQLEIQQVQLQSSIDSRDRLKQVVSSLAENSKERREAEDKLADQEQKITDQVENIANTASQLLSAQANKGVNDWVNKLFGFDGSDAMGTDLDWYASQWELINKNADYYLDDVNKAYNIQKLQSQYVDLLDNVSALSTQRKITDQMNEQLEYLRDKTKLSEYDVAYAQAQLEILKQQIALEEAQANKSQMKLRRDSQGNYNYVYTANQDDVKSAQDSLLDAQNNAYNLSKDQMRQTQEDSLSAIQQAKQTLIDIWTDASLSTEEKEARMEFIIGNLKDYLESTGEQLSTSESNIINDFYGMVDALTQTNAEGLKDVYDRMKEGSLDAFQEIDGHWGNLMSNTLENINKMEDFGSDLLGTMKDTVDEYVGKIEEAAKISGENLDDITANFGTVDDAVIKLNDSCEQLKNTLKSVAESIGTMGKSLQDYQDKILKLTDENSLYRKEVESLKAEIERLQHEAHAGSTESAVTGGVNRGSGGSGGNNGAGGANGDLGTGDGIANVGDSVTLKSGSYYYYDSWARNPLGNMFAGVPNGVTIDFVSPYADSTHPFHIKSTYDPSYSDLGWVRLDDIEGYDTGGYTGSWSDGSGKLAMLHSKEIVLNAADTENILKAVESVRAMTSAMKGVSLAEAVGSIGNIGRSIESMNGTVDQNVSITAEFPNATSADEIKEALLGLNNQVLHYAHRKA